MLFGNGESIERGHLPKKQENYIKGEECCDEKGRDS